MENPTTTKENHMGKFNSQAWPMQILIEKFLRSDHILKSKLNADDRIFIVILASYMGNKIECWPGYEAIINDSGIASKTTINKVAVKLESLKILTVERKHRNNNRYKFTQSFLNSCVQICTQVLQICTQQSTSMYPNNNINNIKNNSAAAHSEKPNQKPSPCVQPKGFGVKLAETQKEVSGLLSGFTGWKKK